MYLIFINKCLKKFNILKSNIIYSLLMFVLFYFIFYITAVIPQKYLINKHHKLINSLKVGDEILISGGIIGKIYKFINSKYILLIINNNQKILIDKNFIKNILSKGTFNINV